MAGGSKPLIFGFDQGHVGAPEGICVGGPVGAFGSPALPGARRVFRAGERPLWLEQPHSQGRPHSLLLLDRLDPFHQQLLFPIVGFRCCLIFLRQKNQLGGTAAASSCAGGAFALQAREEGEAPARAVIEA